MMTDRDWQDHNRQKMFAAIEIYEEAKRRYASNKKKYTKDLTGVDLINAEYRAASDPFMKKAISDAAFYSNEAKMYAAVVSALKS